MTPFHAFFLAALCGASGANPASAQSDTATRSPARTAADDSAAARKDSAHRRRGERFYHAKPYGSEAQFGPLTELLNEGFDMLRDENYARHVLRRQYGIGAKNIINSLLHADKTYRFYGYRRALRNEILPLTWSDNGTGGQGWE